jgi:aspartate/methionine/tyrosine aminotransferase
MKNELANQLNSIIKKEWSELFSVLSSFGKSIYFPKGILFQSAEAKQKASTYNATIGIAKEKNKAMFLKSVSNSLPDLNVNDYLTYAPASGKPLLRKKWLDSMCRKNLSLKDKNVSLPIVTNGITHGLSIAADLFINKDDTIICSDMHWENYDLMLEVRYGAKIKNYKFYNDNDEFNTVEFDKILKKFSKKLDKLILILNFPSNPNGYSLKSNETEKVIESLIKYSKDCKIVVICDDAYFGLFYEDDICKESLFSKISGISNNLIPIKLDAPTKEDYVWGFRTGFITFGFPKNVSGGLLQSLEKKVMGSIRSVLSNCSNVSQEILLKTYESATYEKEKASKYRVMFKRYKKVREVLKNPKYADVWKPYNFNSGYFMCLKLNESINAEELRQELLDKQGIGTIAMNTSDLRVAFSSIEEKDIENLFEKIFETAKQFLKVS